MDEPPRLYPGDLKALALALGLAALMLALWAFLEIASHLKGHTMNAPIASKINWVQILAALASVGVIFGIDIPASEQLAIVGGIQAAQSVLTVVFRTFYTAK